VTFKKGTGKEEKSGNGNKVKPTIRYTAGISTKDFELFNRSGDMAELTFFE
jgi:hypothetical protein